MRILVTGGGGFIGGHLVNSLEAQGHEVRSVDCKPEAEWHQVSPTAENMILDLNERDASLKAADGMDQIYNLAADMGGMGFIENNKAACMLSVLISTHMLMAACDKNVGRVFYASSACVYNGSKQSDPNLTALAESDAYPADPEDGYGWEKLFSERMGRHFMEDYGIEFRTARYHNVYGPHGSWTGGREKAPAAVCRKIAEAKRSGNHTIEVWGDGLQTRSFMYVDDCVKGTDMLMNSDVRIPLNIGSSELIAINDLYRMVAGFAGIEIELVHDLSAPQGVRGRNSDNTLIQEQLGWQPSISLEEGMLKTYEWIEQQVRDHT
ncbi:MAG: NAD-dependent epimerase/dehydratase family protein [Acidimicrobiia bacterium]|nr:NAD-dependent epimerase/dehydratase family protein [Acidimicrobiia bacterium]